MGPFDFYLVSFNGVISDIQCIESTGLGKGGGIKWEMADCG